MRDIDSLIKSLSQWQLETSCSRHFFWVKGILNNLNKLVPSDDKDAVRYILHIQLYTYETHRTTNHASCDITQQEPHCIGKVDQCCNLSQPPKSECVKNDFRPFKNFMKLSLKYKFINKCAQVIQKINKGIFKIFCMVRPIANK